MSLFFESRIFFPIFVIPGLAAGNPLRISVGPRAGSPRPVSGTPSPSAPSPNDRQPGAQPMKLSPNIIVPKVSALCARAMGCDPGNEASDCQTLTMIISSLARESGFPLSDSGAVSRDDNKTG